MRRLFIQRHGAAAGEPPAERRLTAAGERELRAAASALARAGLRLGAIVHSPLTRTRQTADLMGASLLPSPGAVTSCPALAPGVDPAALVAWLSAYRGGGDAPLLLVGHMPDVALLAARWSTIPSVSSLTFAPGTLARLDFSGPIAAAAAELRWVLPVGRLAAAVAAWVA